METRKITVVSTVNQRTYTVDTDASTLQELKEALDNAEISYEGMAFFEGLTKTELVSDNSLLPHDVEYKGNITNDLVIMLTNSKKNISSGSDRKSLYEIIKAKGIQGEVKEKFGKNYTLVSSEELEEFIKEQYIATEKEAPAEEKTPSCGCKEEVNRLDDKLTALIDILYDNDIISYKDLETLTGLDHQGKKESDSPYSKEELEEMCSFI